MLRVMTTISPHLVVPSGDSIQAELDASDVSNMLPNIPKSSVVAVFDACNRSFDSALDCLLTGPTLTSLQEIISQYRLQSVSQKIVVQPDDVLSSALVFYKSPNFDCCIPPTIHYIG